MIFWNGNSKRIQKEFIGKNSKSEVLGQIGQIPKAKFNDANFVLHTLPSYWHEYIKLPARIIFHSGLMEFTMI